MPKKKITKKKSLSKSQETFQTNQEEPKKQDKQFYYIIGAMVGLILLFLLAHSFFQSLKTFEYQGLEFTKEKFGDIPLYSYYYYTNPDYATGNVISGAGPRMINIYLRHDPRENTVPCNDEIELPRGRFVYVSLNSTGLTECPYSTLALAGLSSFFNQNGFEIKAGVPDEAEAKKDNLEYINCEQYPDNAVILIQSGDETKIERGKAFTKEIIHSEGQIIENVERSNCYTITVANCEILQATEKFMIQSIIDAKNRA